VRILHVITTIDRGGAEKQLLTLVREQIRNGKTVTVIYLKGQGELLAEFEAIGSDVDSSITNRSFFFKLVRLCSFMRGKFDIIHAHLPEAEILTSLTFTRTPIIVSRHNSECFFPNSKVISRLLSMFVESRVKGCIAISRAVKSFLIESREWENLNNISIVHYGIDCSNLSIKKSFTSQQVITFLTIGRLVPQKSIPFLLRSFAEHIKDFTNDKLIIVGDGYLSNFYKQLAKELNIEKHVSWIGRVENVNTFYRSSDVFVLASKYEGFGLVLLEAMCENIAILGSNVSSIPEVLGPNHPGLFESENVKDLARAMQLSRRADFREKIIAHQNQKLNEYRPILMEKKIDLIYRSILEST
jgi:glycosyltransferase involved in cell wall biosynthesis